MDQTIYFTAVAVVEPSGKSNLKEPPTEIRIADRIDETVLEGE